MGTSPVDLTKSIAALCRENNIFFADAPVARTREAAIQGDLSIMAGCTPSHFERLLPFLKHMGTEVTRSGEAGSGQIVKILNNRFSSRMYVPLARQSPLPNGTMSLPTSCWVFSPRGPETVFPSGITV